MIDDYLTHNGPGKFVDLHRWVEMHIYAPMLARKKLIVRFINGKLLLVGF